MHLVPTFATWHKDTKIKRGKIGARQLTAQNR